MTSTLTRATIEALAGRPYGALGSGFDIVAISLLAVLLFARDILDDPSCPVSGIRAFDAAIVPLLLVFIAMAASRIAALLQR